MSSYCKALSIYWDVSSQASELLHLHAKLLSTNFIPAILDDI